jgi:hypothetical protein
MQVLDPTQHSASAEALEAIEFFAHEVQLLLNWGKRATPGCALTSLLGLAVRAGIW